MRLNGICAEFGTYTLTADSLGKPVEEQIINGSTIVFLADSIEEVWGYVKADPYWENNVVSDLLFFTTGVDADPMCYSGIKRRRLFFLA